jgi:hypothetical protein
MKFNDIFSMIQLLVGALIFVLIVVLIFGPVRAAMFAVGIGIAATLIVFSVKRKSEKLQKIGIAVAILSIVLPVTHCVATTERPDGSVGDSPGDRACEELGGRPSGDSCKFF